MAKKKKAADAAPKLYTTLEREAEAELTERKSVFIGRAAPVKTNDEAQAFIAKVRAAHADAKHNVYAYLLGEAGVTRCSDDGEPQGTAGVPVLDVIRKGGFCDAVIVVTRYFGGVLLGAGGLVRAYSAAASMAVEKAHIISYESYTECVVRCAYPEYPRIENELPKFGALRDGTDFGGEITLRLAVRDAVFDDFAAKLSEMTSGKVRPIVTGRRYDK